MADTPPITARIEVVGGPESTASIAETMKAMQEETAQGNAAMSADLAAASNSMTQTLIADSQARAAVNQAEAASIAEVNAATASRTVPSNLANNVITPSELTGGFNVSSPAELQAAIRAGQMTEAEAIDAGLGSWVGNAQAARGVPSTVQIDESPTGRSGSMEAVAAADARAQQRAAGIEEQAAIEAAEADRIANLPRTVYGGNGLQTNLGGQEIDQILLGGEVASYRANLPQTIYGGNSAQIDESVSGQSALRSELQQAAVKSASPAVEAAMISEAQRNADLDWEASEFGRNRPPGIPADAAREADAEDAAVASGGGMRLMRPLAYGYLGYRLADSAYQGYERSQDFDREQEDSLVDPKHALADVRKEEADQKGNEEMMLGTSAFFQQQYFNLSKSTNPTLETLGITTAAGWLAQDNSSIDADLQRTQKSLEDSETIDKTQQRKVDEEDRVNAALLKSSGDMWDSQVELAKKATDDQIAQRKRLIEEADPATKSILQGELQSYESGQAQISGYGQQQHDFQISQQHEKAQSDIASLGLQSKGMDFASEAERDREEIKARRERFDKERSGIQDRISTTNENIVAAETIYSEQYQGDYVHTAEGGRYVKTQKGEDEFVNQKMNADPIVKGLESDLQQLFGTIGSTIQQFEDDTNKIRGQMAVDQYKANLIGSEASSEVEIITGETNNDPGMRSQGEYDALRNKIRGEIAAAAGTGAANEAAVNRLANAQIRQFEEEMKQPHWQSAESWWLSNESHLNLQSDGYAKLNAEIQADKHRIDRPGANLTDLNGAELQAIIAAALKQSGAVIGVIKG